MKEIVKLKTKEKKQKNKMLPKTTVLGWQCLAFEGYSSYKGPNKNQVVT